MKNIVLGLIMLGAAGSAQAGGDALYKQGMAFFESDPQVAYGSFIQAVGKGHVQAMAAAGYCCENGIGVAANWGVASQWYKMASFQDPVAACQGLGAICSLGRGVRLGDAAERLKRFEEYGADAGKVGEQALRLLGEGRQLDAEDLLDRALAVFPEDQRLAFMRGVLWRSRFTTTYSYICFNAALSLDGDSVFGKVADTAIKMDNEEQVSEGFIMLRSLMRQHPDELLFHWLFAIQCRGQKRFQQDGAKAYETILEQWKPGPVMVHHTYANILSERLRRNEEALKHRKIALQQAERSWTCQGMANTLYKLNRWAEAEPFYAKAAELDSDDLRHWQQWGDCLVKLERFNEAATVFRKAVEADPTDLDALESLANCLVEKGEYEEALNLYNQVLEVNPNMTGALSGLGLIYREGLGVEKDENKVNEYNKRYHDALKKFIQDNSSRGAPPPPKVEDFDKGSAKGCAAIGGAYYSGKHGTEQDYAKAAEYYKLAVEMGEANNAYELAKIYTYGGHGVARNTEVALEWYEWLFEQGDKVSDTWRSLGLFSAARICLGCYGEEGVDGEKAVRFARIHYQEEPDVDHAMLLAKAYAVNGSFEEAAGIMEEQVALAEANGRIRGLDDKKELLALYRAGKLHEIDRVKQLSPDPETAPLPLRPADLTMREITPAMKRPAYVRGQASSIIVSESSEGYDFYREAQTHAYGRDGNKRDNVKALELLGKSYEVGDSFKGNAALAIGNIHARGGHGAEKNAALSLEWYAKAIEAGNNGAYGQLINFYLSPRVPAQRDLDKALEYARILEVKDPENASSLRWVATAYAQAGQFDIAVQVQEKAIALYKKARAPNERYMEYMERNLEKFRGGEKPYDY